MYHFYHTIFQINITLYRRTIFILFELYNVSNLVRILTNRLTTQNRLNSKIFLFEFFHFFISNTSESILNITDIEFSNFIMNNYFKKNDASSDDEPFK
ncbi:unnamed protein product [Rotaria magnacalcarata]|uniref:Uncharacterized protein n=1 Tax=Rotaria magnacalcarata TaxID=392030 RepID=A0A814TN20_9BILA|nr:unnamed protein product [Rotaria magnacalcarata]CAF1667484.1 unnamed protein product [Rotaria magnacalcarata]